MTATKENPAVGLLLQAVALLQNTNGIPVVIDYEAITRQAVKAAREEMQRWRKDPRVLITQNEANQRYGKSVITSLVRTGYLQQYKFGFRESYDENGEKIVRSKGVIYYRTTDIEEAIENGNVLKGVRRVRV